MIRCVPRMLLIMHVICVNAYVYQVKVLQPQDPHSKNRCIIGMSDFHDKTHPSNAAQRAFFLQLLSSIKDKTTCVVITEDLSSPNIYGSHQSHHYTIASRQGMLAGLTKDCQQRGFTAYNLEYRYARVIALGQLLHQPLAHPFQHQPACTVTIADLLGEVEKMAAYVQSSLVDQHTTALYMRTMAKMKKAIKRLELSSYKTSSCAAFLHLNTTHESRTAFLKELLTFDSCLIDCAIVNQITQLKDATHIIVVAGGTHITRVCNHLATQGYRQSFQSDLMLEQPHGITTHVCAGALRQADRPAPIDLSCLQQFIK